MEHPSRPAQHDGNPSSQPEGPPAARTTTLSPAFPGVLPAIVTLCLQEWSPLRFLAEAAIGPLSPRQLSEGQFDPQSEQRSILSPISAFAGGRTDGRKSPITAVVGTPVKASQVCPWIPRGAA